MLSLAICDCVVRQQSVFGVLIEQFEVASEERVEDIIILCKQGSQRVILVETR